MASPSDFVKRWEAWGIPAAVSAISPWYEKIFSFQLISNYWQTELNLFSSGFAVITAMICFAIFLSDTRENIKRRLLFIVVLFAISFSICLGLQLSVGVAFFPPAHAQWVIWFIWITLYVSIFSSLSAALVFHT